MREKPASGTVDHPGSVNGDSAATVSGEPFVSPETGFVVTGGSGWIGRAVLDALESATDPSWFRGRVLVAASRSRAIRLRSGTEVPALSLAEIAEMPSQGPYVLLHLAALARDRASVMSASGFAGQSQLVRRLGLDLAGRDECRTVVVASSGAVYEVPASCAAGGGAEPYASAKRMDEVAFAELCGSRGIPFAISRIFNVSGPYMTRPHIYALGDLALQGIAGERIQVRARVATWRSYVGVMDVARVWLAAVGGGLLEGGRVFDVAGAEVVEVGALATRVRDALRRQEIEICRGDVGPGEDRYVGDPVPFAELAAACGVEVGSLDRQIEDTIADLRRVLREPLGAVLGA